MLQIERRSSQDKLLRQWATAASEQALKAVNFTIGLMSGSRLLIDRRAVDRLTCVVAERMEDPTLLIRLMVTESSVEKALQFTQGYPFETPPLKRSALGNWNEVSLAIPVGGSAPVALQSLPKWLAGWKRNHRLILIDLGPMHQVPARTIGRYCDNSYIVLGPVSCASHAWIMREIAILDHCGVSLAGTIIVADANTDAQASSLPMSREIAA